MFICISDQYSTTILSGYLDIVEELVIRSNHHSGLEYPISPSGLLMNCTVIGASATRGNASIFSPHRSYMFPFSTSGRINPPMLRLRCIALIMMLIASLSHVEPGQVIFHVKTVLTRVVICDVYCVGVDFDPNRRDRTRSALQGHR